MSYKNLKHYRHTVHMYLDAIWKLGWHKTQTRTSMYKILATRMGLSLDETHVSKFNRNQCRQAIQILKPMYIQLYGKDLEYARKEVKMYYSQKTFKLTIASKVVNKEIGIEYEKYWYPIEVTVYCKSKKLTSDGWIIDYNDVALMLNESIDKQFMNDRFDFNPTFENLAKWICNEIVPCYKIKIENSDMCVIYEEEKD